MRLSRGDARRVSNLCVCNQQKRLVRNLRRYMTGLTPILKYNTHTQTHTYLCLSLTFLWEEFSVSLFLYSIIIGYLKQFEQQSQGYVDKVTPARWFCWTWTDTACFFYVVTFLWSLNLHSILCRFPTDHCTCDLLNNYYFIL